MRLDRFLCELNIGTRSQVKAFIRQGIVAVGGIPAKDPNQRIDELSDRVTFRGTPLEYRRYVYYMMNKPEGVVSATRDNVSRTVVSLLGKDAREDIFPVGRLDKDVTGFLLLTNDGDLAHSLGQPEIRRLEAGVDIGEERPTLPARVELLTEDDGRKEDKTIRENKVLLTLHEGKFHQVKRMLQAVGNEVVGLQRVAFGGLRLDPELEPGEYRELTEEELAILQESCMEV